MTMKQLSVPQPQISSRRDADDGLKVVASVEEAVELANDSREPVPMERALGVQ